MQRICDLARLRCAFALVIALAAACGSKDAGESAGGGVAGTVVTVGGQVTATRAADDAQARPLAEGDSVFADDTISTADGASITIELAHNGARWSLTGGVSRRVDRSPAWRAHKGSGGQLLGNNETDRTAAAGRHAERGATDRAADIDEPATAAAEPEPEPEIETETAAATKDVAPPGGPPAPVAPAPAAVPPPPPPKLEAPPPAPDPSPAPKRVKRSAEKRRPSRPRIPDKGPKGDDPLDGLIDDDPPERRKLTRAEVLEGIAKIRRDVATCSEQHDGKGKTVRVAFVIDPKGRVSRADARGDHAGTALGKCMERAVKKARFPSGRETTPVTFPFRL